MTRSKNGNYPRLSEGARWYERPSLWSRTRTAFLGVLFIAIATASLLIQVSLPGQVALSDGDVSSTDIRAPRRFTFVSEALTEQERILAESHVEDIYDPPQARIARQQIERARAILRYIEMVRSDALASPARKLAWLAGITDVPITEPVGQYVLEFDNDAWKSVAAEVISVLDQSMREEIRGSRLDAVRRSVPALVNPLLSEEQNQVVSLLVQGLLKPNAFFNAEKTAEARRKANESVQPISRTFEQGEVILRAGDIVDPLDVEALQELGLQQQAVTWDDIVGAGGFVLICCVWLGLYLYRHVEQLWRNPRYSALLFVLLTVFTIAAKLMVPSHVVLPYLFPLAALSMLLTVLINFQLGYVITLFMSLLVGHMSGGSFEITVYVLLGGLVGPIILGKAERISAYFWAGLFIATVNAAVVLAFRLPDHSFDLLGLLTLIGASLVNGLASATVTLASFYFLGSLFGITTNLRLLELSRPTQPLLRELLLNAPGTYHHSIMVSNIAEEAATRVGADALLTRVGCYYHDVGKIRRAYFFIENQMDGVNVHERLDPKTSSEIIRQHVRDGIELGQEHGLPQRVLSFIPEHHGTTVSGYFYNVALKDAKNEADVKIDDYRYPGPKPQSRETAIVMLADGCESAVRSARPVNAEGIDEIVQRIIRDRLQDGQLDDCELTMRDLQIIRRTFVSMLQSVFHPRIQYPERVQKGERKPAVMEPPQP